MRNYLATAFSQVSDRKFPNVRMISGTGHVPRCKATKTSRRWAVPAFYVVLSSKIQHSASDYRAWVFDEFSELPKLAHDLGALHCDSYISWTMNNSFSATPFTALARTFTASDMGGQYAGYGKV